MIKVKCTYDDGDTITTGFNGDFKEAAEYFLGNVFNIGSVKDRFQKCINIEEDVPDVKKGSR